MKQGFLVYKCRRCGKLNKNIHVPDGLMTLFSVMNNVPLPKQWGDIDIKETGFCSCDDGNIGISDLIGFEKD